MKILFLMLGSMSAWAGGLDRPVIGYVMDARGAWHAVEGIAGAFVIGAATEVPEPYALTSAYTLEHRENGFVVVDSDGGTKDILPPEANCAALLDRGVLYATDEELVLGDVRFALHGVMGLRVMSGEFVQVSTLDGEYLLRVETGREALFALPAVPAEDRQ